MIEKVKFEVDDVNQKINVLGMDFLSKLEKIELRVLFHKKLDFICEVLFKKNGKTIFSLKPFKNRLFSRFDKK